MALDLVSVESKLNRAEEHLQVVSDELVTWVQLNPCRFEHERNDDFTEYRLVARFGAIPPFRRWSLIVGDCITNLRSALDHLIFAISVHEYGNNPPPNESAMAFVIADSPEAFRDARKRIAHLSLPVRNAIETVQPYNRPNHIVPPFLAVLRDLVNTDKHRMLKLTFVSPHRYEVQFTTVRAMTLETTFSEGEVYEGAHIVVGRTANPEPDLKCTAFTIAMVVAIHHKPITGIVVNANDRTELSTILKLMLGEVRSVIAKVTAAVR